MKKLLCVAAFLALAAGLPLWGYDTSPSTWQIVPEVIWAAASGGGTWVTEVQITNFGPNPVTIRLYFDSTAGPDQVGINIGPIPVNNSVKYANILATMDDLDPSEQVYYGLVGALWLSAIGGLDTFQVQAQTVNGNYGKTFPGLNVVAGNTLALTRPMMIQGLVKNAAYRTSIGVYNVSGTPFTLKFTIYDATYGVVGTPFEKTVTALGFMAFNPFIQAVSPPGDFDNCWIYVEVLTGDSGIASSPMLYGSIANNYTNDTYALMAKQYGTEPTPPPAPPIRY